MLTDEQIIDQAVAHMGRLIAQGRTDDDVARLVAIELTDLHAARAAA